MRSRCLAVALGCLVPLTLGGCIPDPEGDFEKYTARTAQDAPPPVDGGGVDSAPPTEAVEGLYFAACLSTLAAGRIDRVLRFYTETKFVPDAPGSPTGKISLKLTPMKLSAGGGPPPTVSRDQTVGATYTVTDAATNAQGVYAAPLGTVNIPGAANPISGRDIVVENAAVPGRFAPGKFCSQLSGRVTTPTDIPLDGAANTCVYFPVKEGDPTPVLKPDRSDFPSTCTL